ncbi:teichoic acids export ABC transporter ATP-binding subunit TagH [Virgibacillus sp. NKC19-3]|uniref:teichoic acids export ABC transporter ATP-binding subunit TagH n=1 Tax=Virgibacillus saliphilus TaxID=2831674 RepID=UPI001C9B8456|nr:teichoic acids export ABC transporter ATP-binding subunit TagH [Virgibacillus sp. NKC19-3]MBY7144667.1 teichoic acids export ABC transporter ATP-binding subunit TagH [Virgibacillus sp. NKC19-3]
MKKAIIAKHITKKYKLYQGNKERLLDLVTPKSYGEAFYALTDVNFEAEKGDIIGFVGINGSGKSTLSNIIAGIVPETSGSVKLNGEASLIAVSAGLKNDLTGRDNIELKCLMLGFNKAEIKELEPAIIEFSELGQFIDQPVKSYSSGMKSRLGFAISVNVDPNILIIDEALSVGDKAFAEKSLNKMKEFKSQGKTMIFVSHSIKQMKEFCEKILWLEFGKVKEYGAVEDVLPKYEAFLKRWKQMTKKERELYRDGAFDDQPVIEEDLSIDYENKYTEKVESRLGRINSEEEVYIFSRPNNANDKKAAKRYKHYVYYIKRKAVYNNELFYLLSELPSAENGVIGWIEAANVKSFKNTVIDQDPKTFYLTGDGMAFNRPWGAKKNCIYKDLSPFRDWQFKVDRTETVGKATWYHGKLDDEQVWVRRKFVKE